MQLVLTEDQELLAKTAADFVAEKSPVAAHARAARRERRRPASRAELWKEMAELGWVGIPFPESGGRADMGLAELAVVLEALGRGLAPEPFLSTVLLGGQALLAGGSEAQQQAWLPGVVSGDKLVTLAYQEARSRYDLRPRGDPRREAAGSGWRTQRREDPGARRARGRRLHRERAHARAPRTTRTASSSSWCRPMRRASPSSASTAGRLARTPRS